MIIQRIGVLSAAKILAATYAALGLLFGALVSLASLLGAAAAFGQNQGAGGAFGMLFGVGAIIILPLFYGTIGFIGGAIGAFIYNLVAGVVGGIELDVE